MIDEAALLAAAREVARHAHAPYSRFAVGAALLLGDGSVVTGANVENASYGLSLCAETVAVATASAAGRLRDVVAVAVIGGAMDEAGQPTGTAPVTPCGRCRQVLNEAAGMGARDLKVICGAPEGDVVERHLLSELLPRAFGPTSLGQAPNDFKVAATVAPDATPLYSGTARQGVINDRESGVGTTGPS